MNKWLRIYESHIFELRITASIDVSFQHPAQQLLEGVSAIGLKLPQLI